MIALHDPLPSFDLIDQDGKHIRSADLLGQSFVLIFYPGDMTPGCTLQLCAIRDEWQDFEDANIKVFGINQGSKQRHKKFQQTFRLPMPLLVDADRTLSKAVGAIHQIFGLNIIKRTVIGVDSQGRVCMIKPGMPKVAEILKAMTAHES